MTKNRSNQVEPPSSYGGSAESQAQGSQSDTDRQVAEEQLDKVIGGQGGQESQLSDLENQTIDDIPAGAEENSIHRIRLDNMDARDK